VSPTTEGARPGERPRPRITLEAMTPEIYDAWVEQMSADYAAEHVAAGNWPAEGSLERARAQLVELLPDGLATEGQQLWSIRDADGSHVGILWVGPRPRAERALFIWDIEIEPAARGHGFGEAALDALHAWARERGYERVGLHVFGSNEVARRLYLRTGYVETDVSMEKRL
jgi:RimJ/RimL family protein N-acetyltransferase